MTHELAGAAPRLGLHRIVLASGSKRCGGGSIAGGGSFIGGHFGGSSIGGGFGG